MQNLKIQSKALLTALFTLLVIVSFAQQAVLTGFVREAGTGESLPGATIHIKSSQTGIAANEYGHYSMVVRGGTIDVVVSFVGYQLHRQTITVSSDTMVNFHLLPMEIEAVEVVGERGGISTNDPNLTTLTMRQIRQVPPFLGEYDIIKGFALTPGVNTGGDGSSGLHVRGGTPDQNLVLLDGATVYNNSHLFGLFSVFNPEAIRQVELIKGGFPARYGGRLSSVMNVTMKEGNRQDYSSSFTIGPLSSQFTIEGPVVRGKSSFMVSSRAAYLSLIGIPWYILYKTTEIDSYMNYYLYDVNAKFNHSFSDSRMLFVSVYTGRDDLTQYYDSRNEKERGNFSWGNATASVRYIDVISPRWFSETMLTANSFDFKNEFSVTEISEVDSNRVRRAVALGSGVFDVSLKQRFEYAASRGHKIVSGVEITQQTFSPDYYNLENIDIINEIPTYRKTLYPLNIAALYLEDQYRISRFTFRTGLRAAGFFVNSTSYHSLEPRFNMEVRATQSTSFALAYTHMQQPLHLLTRSGGGEGIPVDVWVPITEGIRPQKANQVSVGLNQFIANREFKLDANLYYKDMRHVIEYKTGLNPFGNLTGLWEDMVERDGVGRAYGAEVMLERREGRLNGWVSYTLAWNQRKFQNINHGEWYNAKYDRRHDLSVVAAYSINREWKVSTTFAFHSGVPFTLPVAMGEDIFGRDLEIYTKRNNYRLPLYHRLDIAFTRDYTSKRGRNASLSFGAFNVYSRVNPYRAALESRSISENGQEVGQKYSYYTGTMFGFIPFFSYTLYFNR